MCENPRRTFSLICKVLNSPPKKWPLYLKDQAESGLSVPITLDSRPFFFPFLSFFFFLSFFLTFFLSLPPSLPFFFVGPYLCHMEVPRFRVELEPCLQPTPQLKATPDP